MVMLFKNKPFQFLSLILIFGIYCSCSSQPIIVLSKKITTNQYISPSRESNINVFDYSCIFIANKNSSNLHFTKVLCNNDESKMYLLNTKNEIISEFKKSDTLLLRASILRPNRISKIDTLTLFYEIKGRGKNIILTNFTKIESPINQ
jgi:hypothetical protein